MKKFSFNLESLLVMREWEERRMRQALSEASAHVTRLQRHVEFLQSEKEKTFSDWSAAGSERFTSADRMNMSSQVAEIESRASDSLKQLELAREERERAMEALSVASRRKRAVENLKEKKREEHEAEALKAEAAEIEDIFNARRAATNI